MIEFTVGGAGFRWSALERESRRLAGWSFLLGAIAGAACGVAMRSATRSDFNLPTLEGPLTLLGIATGLISAWLWYRFSLRQDEMFSRVQNWTLGMAGAWTALLATAWTMLAKVALAPPIPDFGVGAIFAGGVTLFWLIAVRRWAS